MSAPTALPCPACGAGVLGGYTLVSGRGVLLNPAIAETPGSRFHLHDHGMASLTAGPGRSEHRCDGGFDAVVSVLGATATVRACSERAERVAKRVLFGRLAGPVGALEVVLARLAGAGLHVFAQAPP